MRLHWLYTYFLLAGLPCGLAAGEACPDFAGYWSGGCNTYENGIMTDSYGGFASVTVHSPCADYEFAFSGHRETARIQPGTSIPHKLFYSEGEKTVPVDVTKRDSFDSGWVLHEAMVDSAGRTRIEVTHERSGDSVLRSESKEYSESGEVTKERKCVLVRRQAPPIL